MSFSFTWLAVLFVNTFLGLLLSRSHWLRAYVDKITFPRPRPFAEMPEKPSDQHPNSNSRAFEDQGVISRRIISCLGRCKKAFQAYQVALLESDDRDYSGFTPPRVTRVLISSFITIQNLIAICTSSNSSTRIESMSHRAGQLCILNMLPLMLSVAPDILLVHILKQGRQQTLWIHVFYGWLVWYEALLHILLSLFAMSQWSKRICSNT